MNSFIFRGKPAAFPEICGRTPLDDLAAHLKNSGINGIYTDSLSESSLVCKMDYSEAEPLLGSNWLAAFEGMITRQSPRDLIMKASEYQCEFAVSLACSGEPWKYTTVLTGERGSIQSYEENPPPENTRTNLCFSGFVFVNRPGFDPEKPLSNPNISAFLIPGYWSIPSDRESYLRTVHEILAGKVTSWSGSKYIISGSRIPASCSISGTLWLGKGCVVGENCVFENCVIMDSAIIGSGASLRNCLVNPGTSVKPGTLIEDKYLTLLGEE